MTDTDKNSAFCILTLIKEKPKNRVWIPISFEKLRNSFDIIVWDKSRKETYFIEEYIETLNNLVVVFNQFMSNHQNFKNVFTDGYKKKFNKEEYKNDHKQSH